MALTCLTEGDDDALGGGDFVFGDDDEDENEEEDSGAGMVLVRVRTSMMDMKIGAIDCLSKLMLHCFKSILPLLPSILENIVKLTTYFHGDVRIRAIQTIQNIVLAQYEDVVGESADPNTTHLPPSTCTLLESMVPLILHRMDDEEKEVAAQCVETFMHFTNRLSAKCFILKGNDLTDSLLQQLFLFLQNKGKCQMLYEEDGYEEDEDDDDHDDILMDAVTDLIGALCSSIGPSFESRVRRLFEPLTRFLRPSRPATDRSMAVGCFAEIVDGLKHACAPYVPDMLKIAVTALEDPHEKVQRNACFLTGVLATHAPDGSVFSQHLNEILSRFEPFLRT